MENTKRDNVVLPRQSDETQSDTHRSLLRQWSAETDDGDRGKRDRTRQNAMGQLSKDTRPPREGRTNKWTPSRRLRLCIGVAKTDFWPCDTFMDMEETRILRSADMHWFFPRPLAIHHSSGTKSARGQPAASHQETRRTASQTSRPQVREKRHDTRTEPNASERPLTADWEMTTLTLLICKSREHSTREIFVARTTTKIRKHKHEFATQTGNTKMQLPGPWMKHDSETWQLTPHDQLKSHQQNIESRDAAALIDVLVWAPWVEPPTEPTATQPPPWHDVDTDGVYFSPSWIERARPTGGQLRTLFIINSS